MTRTYRFPFAVVTDISNKSMATRSHRDPRRHVPWEPFAGTGTYVPGKQYRMPGKNERRPAIPANKLDSVTYTQSANVRQTGSHEIDESSTDAPDLAQQAEKLPTEEPDGAIISRPCPQTGCQSAIANTVTPEKGQRTPTMPEPLQTVPTFAR